MDYDYLLKIVLIGDSGSGKSCLLQRIFDNTFKQDSKSTIGVEFATHVYEMNDTKSVKVQIWDTAGQDRYRAITNAYYRGSVGIIIVYDITNRTSFNNVLKWYNESLNHSDKIKNVLLVGSKLDLKHLRNVTSSEGKELADKNNMDFIEVSSLTGENVFIEKFIKDIYKNFIEEERKLIENPIRLPIPIPIHPSPIHPHIQKSSKFTCTI